METTNIQPDSTYIYEEFCENCKQKMEFEIPKGKPIDKYFDENETICYNCGC